MDYVDLDGVVRSCDDTDGSQSWWSLGQRIKNGVQHEGGKFRTFFTRAVSVHVQPYVHMPESA